MTQWQPPGHRAGWRRVEGDYGRANRFSSAACLCSLQETPTAASTFQASKPPPWAPRSLERLETRNYLELTPFLALFCESLNFTRKLCWSEGARGGDGDERIIALTWWVRKAWKSFEALASPVGMLWPGMKVGAGRAFSGNEDVRETHGSRGWQGLRSALWECSGDAARVANCPKLILPSA